jgi:quercetin dioxygenase-like cupin family protein
VTELTYQQPQSINADLDKPALADSNSLPWQASPQVGVERRMLDRQGAEVARATSIVRYAPESRFPSHAHTAGEEFLVLEGIFSDEHGDYPAGSYVRNPPGTSHAPHTQAGCIILVKLRQMREQGEPPVVIDSNQLDWETAGGVSRKRLFSAPWGEQVAIERLQPNEKVPAEPGPLEVFLLDGSLEWGATHCAKGAWLRLPDGLGQNLVSGQGCVYWVKRRHW